MAFQSKKSVMAICRATYRGYSILEMAAGVYSVQLGTKWCSSRSLTALTGEIDKWLDLKKN